MRQPVPTIRPPPRPQRNPTGSHSERRPPTVDRTPRKSARPTPRTPTRRSAQTCVCRTPWTIWTPTLSPTPLLEQRKRRSPPLEPVTWALQLSSCDLGRSRPMNKSIVDQVKVRRRLKFRKIVKLSSRDFTNGLHSSGSALSMKAPSRGGSWAGGNSDHERLPSVRLQAARRPRLPSPAPVTRDGPFGGSAERTAYANSTFTQRQWPRQGAAVCREEAVIVDGQLHPAPERQAS